MLKTKIINNVENKNINNVEQLQRKKKKKGPTENLVNGLENKTTKQNNKTKQQQTRAHGRRMALEI